MDELWKPDGNTRLKLKIKKRNNFLGKSLEASCKGQSLSPLVNILNGRNRPKKEKRKNPFQCEANDSKRAKYGKSSLEDKENDFSYFKVTKDRQDRVIPNIPGSEYDSLIRESDVTVHEERFENSDGKAKVPANESKFEHHSRCEDLPTDWSLKTKLKFKSDKQFTWCTNLKSTQISQGTVNFIRCTNEHIEVETHKEVGLDIEFRKNLSYWKHPCLPCIPSFPLSERSLEVQNPSSFINICKDVAMQTEIMKDWAHSFQSVFTLAKCGFCPYFYMCCQKIMCLFIGSGVQDGGMMAVITPTTKGLRDLLTKEGIEFTMPHFNKESKDKKPYCENMDELEEENENEEHEEDFLASIGLNKKNFSSIEKHRIASEISKLNSVDNRSQSTLLVKDFHVNALFNFFVNSDVIVSQSGAWQGVPPTLFSPVAFEGASLQTLKCVQGPMKIQENGGMRQVFCLEISGPILPTQFYNLCHLVKDSNASYEAAISVSMHSSALNIPKPTQPACSEEENSLKLGISMTSLKYLRSNTISSGGLTSIIASGGDFEWKTTTT